MSEEAALPVKFFVVTVFVIVSTRMLPLTEAIV